jgi:hypothetical protein
VTLTFFFQVFKVFLLMIKMQKARTLPFKSNVLASAFSVICDLDWIQTSNLLSRNQVRYSVAPQGLFVGANIGI